ncbi:MAG: hypothetical protein Fur0012_06790 [Elusimicrobiota bacterium]
MAENSKYWAYIRKNIVGPFEARKISEIPGFNQHTLVCPEKSLGQWRECSCEEDFSVYLQLRSVSNQAEKEMVKKAVTENEAFKKILEQTLIRNRGFEKELENLSSQYRQARQEFEKSLKEKDETIKALKTALEEEKKKNLELSRAPSWERLYDELKHASEQKLAKLRAEKESYLNEIDSLKNRIQSTVNAYEASKNKITEKFLSEKNELLAENARLKAMLEEKETVTISLNENIRTLIAKNNEFHRMLTEEKAENEKRIYASIGEISKLKTDLSSANAENARLREEISQLSNKLKILDEAGSKKEQEQEEIFKIIHSKIKLLNAYFSGLENRLKKAEE